MKTAIESLDTLFEETRRYSSSKEFRELFKFFKRFRHMSVYNAMLVRIQKPGCLFATTTADWANRYNRTIKPEATPLVILRPFGPVAFIYDLSDTVGDSLPDYILNPFESYGGVNPTYSHRLINNMKALGIDFINKDQGSHSGGYITTIAEGEFLKLCLGKNVYIIKKTHLIVVNSGLSSSATFATIAHELGHYFCDHLGRRNHLTKNQKEFEAECVSYIICERLDIKTTSESYLWNYLDEHNQIPQISIDGILKAVGKIENMYKTVQKPKKKVIAT